MVNSQQHPHCLLVLLLLPILPQKKSWSNKWTMGRFESPHRKLYASYNASYTWLPKIPYSDLNTKNTVQVKIYPVSNTQGNEHITISEQVT